MRRAASGGAQHRAGLAGRRRQQAARNSEQEGAPRALPLVFNNWRDDPVARLVEETEAAAQPFLNSGSLLKQSVAKLREIDLKLWAACGDVDLLCAPLDEYIAELQEQLKAHARDG
jgi:hypothetical protein